MAVGRACSPVTTAWTLGFSVVILPGPEFILPERCVLHGVSTPGEVGPDRNVGRTPAA
ncbi:MAG: hypothetical protein ACE5HF_09785 [Gemmatimonadota bacterium]